MNFLFYELLDSPYPIAAKAAQDVDAFSMSEDGVFKLVVQRKGKRFYLSCFKGNS